MTDRGASQAHLVGSRPVDFLDHVAEGLDTDVDVHVILDHVSAHKSATVLEWRADPPRWHCHFTPTSASWVNAVEGFFSERARQRRKDAIFNSLEECTAAMEAFRAHHNAHQGATVSVATVGGGAGRVLAAEPSKAKCDGVIGAANYYAYMFLLTTRKRG